jgi:putative DNA primase/helicase
MAIEQGHRVIPVIGKTPAPYGKGDRYALTDNTWRNRKLNKERVGIALDDFILVDYDGNKPEGAIPLEELFAILGDEPTEVQRNNDGDSLHYLYRIPSSINKESLKHSNDGWLHGVDIKTKNQLMYLKAHKIIIDDELPQLDEVPEAPQVLIDALTIVQNEVIEIRKNSKTGKLKAAEILSYIDPDVQHDIWVEIGMALHHEFKGDPIGLELWDNWSIGGDKYKGFSLLKYKWETFSLDKSNGVKFGSICHFAQQAGADLSEINNRYDNEGNPLPTFDELMSMAKEMSEDTPESEIEYVVQGTRNFSPIQRRRIFDCVKRQTKLPLTTLQQALKESSPEDEGLDQLMLAKKVVDNLGRENVIAASSFVWGWNDCGVWKKLEERTIRQFVHDTVPPLVDVVNKTLIEGVSDLFKTEIFKPEHEFDVGEPESVNCLNGELSLYDVAGGWILEDHNKLNYRTTQIPVVYDENAQAPRFLQFMNEVFKGDKDADDKIKALLEMVGYSLMAHCRHERFIILVGSGANGKSVLLSVLEALCGSINVAGVQPSQFDNKFQRAHLHGKLANIVTEIEQGQVIADAALKGIVSGEPSTVEHKHKDPFMMRPFSTCWFGTNHMPHTRDFSDALFRRALVVSFNNTFKPELGNCDPNLKDKLLDELAGILNLALEAYAKAIVSGFTMPESCDAARKEWRLEADQVAQFVDECCITDSNCETAIGDVFDNYLSWSSDNGINRKLAKKGFRDRLTRLGYGDRRTKKTRFVTGLKVKSLFDKSFSYDQIRG